MNDIELKNGIKSLNRYAFDAFILKLFEQDMDPIYTDGNGLFTRQFRDFYSGATGYFNIFYFTYFTHYLPNDVLSEKELTIFNVGDPEIVYRLEKIKEVYDKNPDKMPSMFFFNQLEGADTSYYEEILIPEYQVLLYKMGFRLRNVGVGNCDSFVLTHRKESEEAYRDIICNSVDEYAIDFKDNRFNIYANTFENPLPAGVTRVQKHPCESVYLRELTNIEGRMQDFMHLLSTNPSEQELEKFLKIYVKDIFGPEYEIKTQILLRFPELDIGQKDKRIVDVLLRNTLRGDWGIYELKKVVSFLRSKSGRPAQKANLTDALVQVRSYYKLLMSDEVKKKFRDEGIEYAELKMYVIIGRKPQVSEKVWKFFLECIPNDIKLITWDGLLENMVNRASNYINALKRLSDI